MSLDRLRENFEKGAISKASFIEQAGEIHRQLFDLALRLGQQIDSIRIEQGKVIYELTGENVFLGLSSFDKRVAPIEAINFGSYEPVLWKVMRACCARAVERGDIVDVGANIGWYTVRLAKAFPSARVVALEPVAATYRELTDNVALNRLSNVTAMPLALAHEPGEGFIEDAIGSSVSNHLISGNLSTGDRAKFEAVTISSVDQLCAQGVIRPAFIKADVEGGELPMLRGASKTLSEHSPIIICELLRKWSARFDYHPNDAIAYMESFGYASWAIGDRGITRLRRMTDETQETNFLFLKNSIHEGIIHDLSLSDVSP